MKRGERGRRQVESGVGVRKLMHILHIMQRKEVTIDPGETGGN